MAATTRRMLTMLCWTVSLLAAGIVLFADSVEAAQHIPKPRKCEAGNTWFRHRRRYVYNYEAKVDIGLVGTTDITSGSTLSCDVTVFVPKKCESTFELSSCKLMESGEDGKLSLSPKSKVVARELEKHPVYVQMNRGQVIDHQFVVDESEPGYVVNIKRAIVSQLQLYILSPRDYDRHVDQYDIFGSCPTRYTFSRESVSTQRDIIRCDVPQVLRRLKSYLSLARQIDTAVLSKPLHELVYPFESTVECTYRLSSQRAIANSECVQVQAFRPVTFHGNLRSTSTSTITQSLSLKQVSKIPRRKSVISRGLEGRRIVDLAMELDLPPAREVTSADLFAQLQGLMESYTSQSEALPPERFQEMVDLLRDAREDILEEVLETLLACRAATGCPLEGFGGKLDPKVVQKLRESLFTDGLLSCGTEPCIATYMTSLQRGMVYSVQGELTLFNMALFYQPTPAILGKMLTLCKSQSSNNCWLTLGTFVNKMAEEVKMSEDKALRDEGAAAIRDVLQHLRVVVGDTCRTGILPEKLKDEHMDIISALLIALKTLANAGGAIQEYHDDVTVNGKDLVPAILNCVENSALPLKISQAAILVLRKVELRKDVRVALTDILSDISRPASLRTEAFDLLLGHEHVDTVRSLLKAMQTEKLSSFQLYMVTRVGHLLESNSPHTASLRKLWRETMIQETARLPELESIKGRGSQYMEFSRYIQLPPMGLPLGGQLGLRVVFDPSTVLPSTIRVALMATFGNSSVEIVELGLDIQGVENIVREVFMSDLNIRRDGPGALIAKIMQAALPKTGGPPTFFFPDENVVESLKKLFLQVNMPTGDVPQAHFHLRILGSDVGFVYLEDLIQMVKQSSRGNDKRPPRVMTLMQQLAQGLNLFVGKSLKMVELEKTIPTVGGFPWQAKVHGTMVASAVLDAGGDIMSFLQRKRPLEINGGLRTSVAVKVWCQQTVRIGDATSAGLRLNMSVLVNGVVGGRMKYAPVRETTSTPGAMKLELALSALKQPLNVIRLRSDIYFLHNDIVQPVTNPASEISVKKCAADAFEKWTGQKVCLDGVYQPVGFAPDTPFPPLSGPIHLDVIARPLDKSLEEYKVIFTLTRKDEKDQPGMTVVFRADHSAEGEKMKRHLNISLELNTATKEAHLEAVVPEIGLQYDLDLRTTYGSKNSAYHGVSSVLTVGPKLLHSFITEYKDEEDQQTVVNPQTGQPMKLTLSDSVLKLNVSVPGLSMEIFTSSVSSKPPGRFSQAMVLRYYCEPQLGIFYSLHPNPEQAAENGHMSEYSFHNEATMTGTTFESMTGVSQADFWRALDTMVIMIPGHNVTLLNQMAANHSFAERDTTIYWTSGIGSANESLDIIHMDAEVNNKSKDRHHSFHYKMDLDHVDKYDIMLQGSMEGALHDLNFHTHVTYKTKPRPERQKRSLRGFLNRLKTAEEAAEESIVSIEETVLRRGAELTESFLTWMAGEDEPVPEMPAQPPSDGNSAVSETDPEAAAVPPDMAKGKLGRRPGALLMLFSRSEWMLDFDANLKVKPVMGPKPRVPAGYDCQWDLNVTLPDLRKRLLAFNGSLERRQGWDVKTGGRLHTDVLNFTLDYNWEQRKGREWPLFYHEHQWTLVEFTKHRFDRSFRLKFDHEEHDRFSYSLDLVSPYTNLSHDIAYKKVSPIHRTVRANMSMHNARPPYNISYQESSDLKPRGLTTDVSLNSTWLDMDINLDADISLPGAVILRKHIDMFGKVSFLNGSHQMDLDLKLNPFDRSAPPSLLFVYTNDTGHSWNMHGKLMKKDHVLFTFSTREPEAKNKATVCLWNIYLVEPTALQHQLKWDPKKSRHVIGALRHFLSAGAHSLRHFGRTMAMNVHKNVSSMVVPYTNMTVSEIVDRVAEGKMKKVAMSGLDPRENVPLSVKVMKGGLNVVQALQTTWSNSAPGKLAHSLGVHKVVSYTILATTGLPHMLLENPPFFLRQYAKFNIQPELDNIAASGQFTFSHPLPFVWNSFLSMPHRGMATRQFRRRLRQMMLGAKADLPFMAIVADSKIQTFDGTTFDISMPSETECTYILATDFVHGNHSLLLSPERATMVAPFANVAIGWDGAVTVNDSMDIARELPSSLTKDNSHVTLKEGQLTVTVPGQLRMTYDHDAQIYVIETAMHVHNRSLGLLGTTSRDPGDDFRLPDGKLASDTYSFQQSYELSKKEECQYANSAVSGFDCEPTIEEFCSKLFTQAGSPIASCFAVVNPSHFYELCRRRACSEIPQKTENACPIVRSYVKLCVNRASVELDTKKLSAMCDDCSKTSHRDLDVVVGVALSEKGLASVDIADVIRNLAAQLERADARFGVVHSDGRAAHAQLFGGELFVSAKSVESISNKKLGNGGVTQSLEAIVRIATQYPFRAHARRLLVLIVDEQYRASPKEEVDALQELLWEKDITLVLVADDKQLDKQRVMAATWDQQVYCKNCRKDDITLPETKVGELAQTSNGLWLSLESVAKGRQGRMRRLMRTFQHIVKQPSPRCAVGGA